MGNVISLNTTLPKAGGGTQTDNQSFCYDEFNQLVWGGNSGTPTSGDHCGLTPTGTTITSYQQSLSYAILGRLVAGPSGTTTYDPTHVHAADTVSSVPNQYASYDAIGNMTCRNIDPTTAHSCAGASPTGAALSYDNEGRLATWTAPSGQTASDTFLYDPSGTRVLQRTSTTTGSTTTVTDTISFDGFTETSLSGGLTTTTKYYTADGMRVAMNQSNAIYYLFADLLGSSSVVLNGDGSFKASQLFAPYGTVRASQGTMPTPYNFTGQRFDSQTGLLYYNSRYYDPVSGRFTKADTAETNAGGLDPYGYVHGNPVTMTDPTGKKMVSSDSSGVQDPTGLEQLWTDIQNFLNDQPPIVVNTEPLWVPIVAPIVVPILLIGLLLSIPSDSGPPPTSSAATPTPTPASTPSTGTSGAGCKIKKCVSAPNDRHFWTRINKHSQGKGKNTIIMPGTDVAGDIVAINDGLATRTPVGGWTINGRSYLVEANGTLIPQTGPGFVQADRMTYKALQTIKLYGGSPDATDQMNLDRIPEAAQNEAWGIYRDGVNSMHP